VDLIQHENRIVDASAPNRLDHPSRHGADISPAMAAQFSLIVHAAEAKAFELTAESPGDRLAQRSFPDAGRTDETKNRRLGGRIQLQDSQVFENSFFDFTEIIVVLIQYLSGASDIEDILSRRFPRQLEQKVQI